MYLETSEGFKTWLREDLTRGTWCDVPALTTLYQTKILFRVVNGNNRWSKSSNSKAHNVLNDCCILPSLLEWRAA
jgi:hypothetical protein